MLLTSPLQLPYEPKRIISLVPSQTELLYHMGLEKETIAITKFCIHPQEWYKCKIKVGGTKTLHLNKIDELKPDLIIANKEENEKEQVEELAAKFNVWVTDINGLEDACKMIADIGKLTNKDLEADELVKKIKIEFNSLHTNSSLLPAAYLIWQKPFMTVGRDSFISNMMHYAGMENVFQDLKRYPEISIEDLKHSGCKILILSSEPYPFTQKHVEQLQPQLPAIKILLADGEMFSWYGSRLLLAPAYFKQLYQLTQI